VHGALSFNVRIIVQILQTLRLMGRVGKDAQLIREVDMLKWRTDLQKLEGMDEEEIFSVTATPGTRHSDVLGTLGVNGKAFEAWTRAQPHRWSRWADARMASRQGGSNGGTQEAAL
jgi:hypothetical protein